MNIAFARAQGEKLAEEWGGSGSAVDVERIARKLRLRIVEADLGAGVSGLLVTSGEDSCICVQKTDSPLRKRFTIAHEIGHFHLKHQFKDGGHVHVDRGHLISQRSGRSSEGVDPVEVEANQFAACLLMRSSRLRAEVDALPGPLSDDVVRQLAERFNVSEQAMTIRLTTLRLL